jgi:hypothetical protein
VLHDATDSRDEGDSELNVIEGADNSSDEDGEEFATWATPHHGVAFGDGDNDEYYGDAIDSSAGYDGDMNVEEEEDGR